MSLNGDAFGSLAALFTTESGGEVQAIRANNGLALGAVTTVLVGNLPVLAGLWTTQFADVVARDGGPTALVRFERNDVTIELLHADGRQVPPVGPSAVSLWLPRAASTVRRWLVCVPADTSAADVLAVGKDIILMTGADEAAVTGAYLRLKYLADEGISSGRPIERVGIVVVGATSEQAAHASARLGDAARSFLGVDVETVVCLPRIERVESSARATFPAEECPSLLQFTRELDSARATATHRFDADNTASGRMMPPEVSAVEPKFQSMPQPFASRVERVERADSFIETTRALNISHSEQVPRTVSVAQSTSPLQPTHAVHNSQATFPIAELPAKLAPLLRGLRPLGVSCPTAPDIELAIDDQRRIHVIGRADQLARVRIARAWAAMHRELLSMAFPELKDGFELRERILLGDAREAIPLQGAGVLLEVLVIADTPTGRVQVIVPLNDPMTCG